MSDLKSFLTKNGYTFLKLKKSVSNHFVIKGKVNDVTGLFIVDTGASNSCVGLDECNLFNLTLQDSDKKAAGAGSTNINTQLSHNNLFKIKNFGIAKISFVVIDLTHINTALTGHNSESINGIIGADILKKYHAIIDYQHQALYLKK
ncbi:MAG: retroviral-like aspartic protease family protein [Flavobacteriaceae bacterium]|nr:retroviral-like aspartic protease family protein [Flavobacteriaceae bacterium]